MINNEYISIILARKGSKRIKNKNLVKINGKPLIEYTLNSIIPIMPPSNIYISTNDENVMRITKKYNINFIKRPEKLCGDKSSSEDGIIHAIDKTKKEKNFKHLIFEIYVKL